MTPKAKYLLLDTETSGWNPYKNGLIEFGGAALDENLEVVATLERLVKPPKDTEVNEESLAVNNISHAEIESGISYNDFCREFRAFLVDNFGMQKPIVIGQFFPFDYAFLQQVFSVEEGQENHIGWHLMGNDFIDTKAVVNYFNLKATLEGKNPPFPITSLSAAGGLKETLGIDTSAFPPHRALSDAMATLEVLKKLLARN